MKKIKYLYKNLKENLNTLILLPTILGGLWQLIELSSISTSFIRFFSITQLISDGLLILFFLTIIFLSILFGVKLFGTENFKIKSRKDILPLSNGITLTILCLFSLIFVVYPPIKHIQKNMNISIGAIAILIPVLIFSGGGFFLGLYRICLNLIMRYPHKFKQARSKVRKHKKHLISLVNFLIVMILIFILKFILIDLNPYFKNFRQNALFPQNLINISKLEDNICEEYELYERPTLIYYNDKYLFYQITQIDKEDKFIIIEFTELLK
ncbi:hypothetical protein GWA97_00095 [Flavobacterium sp. LaA7.5]|nr:hypothetical protein [Flavobacterium salilacus subsp. altitudinum]